MRDEDRILQKIEEDSNRKTQAVRQMLIDGGHTEALAEFDKNMKDLRLGVTQARSIWRALSNKQRDVLAYMGQGVALNRKEGTDQFFIPLLDGLMFRACNLPTARNLSARELVAPDGGAFTPEARFIITERGRFVLKYGPEPAPPPTPSR